MKKKHTAWLVLVLTAASCSSVFNASLTGRIVDSENPDTGLGNVIIAIYDSSEDRNDDEERFYASPLAVPTDSFSSYLQKTESDADGTFQINNLIWSSSSPDFGKDGDYKTFYFLLYHKDYGLSSAQAQISSDSTSRLEPFKLTRNLNQAVVRGRLVSTTSRDQGITGATVSLRIPEDWDYSDTDTDGTDFTDVNWSSHADFLIQSTTDDYGYFSATVRFKPVPNREEDKGTVPLRLSFDLAGYETAWLYATADDTAIGSGQEIQAAGIDHDGSASTAVVNWTLSDPKYTADTAFTDLNSDGRNDVVYETILSNGSTLALDQDQSDFFGIKQVRFSPTLSGRVETGGVYQNNQEVWLFLSDDTGANPLTDGRYPDYWDVTASVMVNNSGTDDYEAGHFTIPDIEWEDPHYSSGYSLRSAVIWLPDADDLAAGAISGGTGLHNQTVNLKGTGENMIEVSY